MLIILAFWPRATPVEAFFAEEFVGEVVQVDFVRELRRVAVEGVWFAVWRHHHLFAVVVRDVRIVQRVDVYRKSVTMPRKVSRAGYEAEVERRSVVVCHRCVVVGVVIVHEVHLFDAGS